MVGFSHEKLDLMIPEVASSTLFYDSKIFKKVFLFLSPEVLYNSSSMKLTFPPIPSSLKMEKLRGSWYLLNFQSPITSAVHTASGALGAQQPDVQLGELTSHSIWHCLSFWVVLFFFHALSAATRILGKKKMKEKPKHNGQFSLQVQITLPLN